MRRSLLRTLEEKVALEASALIVIDMQNDFCHPNGFTSRRGKELTQIKEMIPKLLEFVAAARQAGGKIFFVKAVYDDKYCNEPMLERKSRLGITDVVCPEGQWGSEFYEGFEPQPEDFVILKTRYSAFLGSNLKEVLEKEGIKSLVVTGVTTNCCVESTARDGFMLGYYIVIPKDLVAAWHTPAHEASLFTLAQNFGVVTNAKDIVDIWLSRK